MKVMRVAKAFKRHLRQLDYLLHETKLALRKHQFSNFNEQQILRKYIDELFPPAHLGTAVDIGAGDGIRRSNTYALFREGWTGVGIESDAHTVCKLARAYKYYPNVALCRCRVTPHNVVPLLQAYGVKREFEVLSLDIDGNDYWVLDALLRHFRPRLVSTEINEKIPPPLKFVVRYDPDFQLRHHFYGYSIAMLKELTGKYDYAVIDLEYNNAFLAPKELPGIKPIDVDTAYRRGYLERADRKEKCPDNDDMEVLHTLPPEDALGFLRRFYSKFDGKYELSIDEELANGRAGGNGRR